MVCNTGALMSTVSHTGSRDAHTQSHHTAPHRTSFSKSTDSTLFHSDHRTIAHNSHQLVCIHSHVHGYMMTAGQCIDKYLTSISELCNYMKLLTGSQKRHLASKNITLAIFKGFYWIHPARCAVHGK